MTDWTVVLTGVTSAASALLGALLVSRIRQRGEDRSWFREQQIAAYGELFRRYLEIAIGLRRANIDRTPHDYDWATWGAACEMAQLLAPRDVSEAIKEFHAEVDVFLSHASNRDTSSDPLPVDQLEAHYSRMQAAWRRLCAKIDTSLVGKSR